MNKYIYSFILFLLLSFSPTIKNGEITFGTEVLAQNYSIELDEVEIEGWDRTTDSESWFFTDNGFEIESEYVTYTDPNDPSNTQSFFVAKVLTPPSPTWSEPVYDGDAFWGTNFIGPGDANTPDPFTSGLSPVDELDRAAMMHDYVYYLSNAQGLEGAFYDTSVRNADLVLMNAAKNTMERYEAGETDQVTGLAITLDTAIHASATFLLFKGIVEDKYGTEF